MKLKPDMVVIIDDRLWKSIASDAVSTFILLATVGLGWFLDSTALQWIAGIIWFLGMIGKLEGRKKQGKMTISEARDFLNKLEGDTPS